MSNLGLAMIVTESSEPDRRPLARKVSSAFLSAAMEQSEVDPDVLLIQGMSGKKYRRLINNLIRSLDDASYLEIGSWAGSTLCSAISRNQVFATAIDNWSQFGGPKERFHQNLQRFRPQTAAVKFIESDFRDVDYAQLGQFQVYLFDGPHSAKDQYDGLAMVLPALAHEFVFIVDDWNWRQVREGTVQAIRDVGAEIHYALEIRTTTDNTQPPIHSHLSDWHNGYFIGVLTQR